jgi:hypothetical protein
MSTIHILLASTVALLLVAVGPVYAQAPVEPTPAVSTFMAATRDYVAMHRRLEDSVGRIELNSSVESINRTMAALAAAIRGERREAKQGDFFSPALAPELRARVNDALREHGFTPRDVRLSQALEGVDLDAVRLQVNDTFPWVLASIMFPCVIEALPPIPSELQYRIVGNDLLLIDVHASLVLDILPNVLVEMTAWKIPLPRENPAEAANQISRIGAKDAIGAGISVAFDRVNPFGKGNRS